MPRRLIASGSPFEPVIGFSRAVVEGHHVVVAGTAPVMPDGGDPPADAFGQTRRVLEIIVDALEVDRRVHAEAIPAAPQEQLALARRLGFEEYPRQTFLEEYRRITRRARRAMERVFYEEEG